MEKKEKEKTLLVGLLCVPRVLETWNRGLEATVSSQEYHMSTITSTLTIIIAHCHPVGLLFKNGQKSTLLPKGSEIEYLTSNGRL